MVGGTKVILGLVETHEKFNRLDWGDDIEHIKQMREQTDKKGGGLTMLKDRDHHKCDKLWHMPHGITLLATPKSGNNY